MSRPRKKRHNKTMDQTLNLLGCAGKDCVKELEGLCPCMAPMEPEKANPPRPLLFEETPGYSSNVKS
jgi:hypothetical protein